MSDTLNDIPIDHDWAWVVIVLQHNEKKWIPLNFTVARTRAEAIDLYETMWGFPGEYARRRRKGQARALQCRISPCTFGEDRRKGATP